jgi:hypothetical protein
MNEISFGMRGSLGSREQGYSLVAALLMAIVILSAPMPAAGSQCRLVGPSDAVSMDKAALVDLAKIGINRNSIFAALKDTSIPETSGCWGGATGNFDGQLISAGVLQWNLGQSSLQPLLKRYKASFTEQAFRQQIAQQMPKFGKSLFSDGCLQSKVTKACQAKITSLQTGGQLDSAFKSELDTLFESNAMVQVQVDFFIRLLERLRSDLGRIFAGKTPSARAIKWAIDTKVQQGGFPQDEDIRRMRKSLESLGGSNRLTPVAGIVRWYEGLCGAVDQGGVSLDCRYNVGTWQDMLAEGAITDEQIDLLCLSFLRSRTAATMGGYWQALTFQRRAKIILGAGSVGGRRTQ